MEHGSNPGRNFASWYAAEAPRAVVTLRAVLGDHLLAEECVAEAFARAYARWATVSRMESPNGWIYVVALNHARSLLRRQRRDAREFVRAAACGAAAPPEPMDPIWHAVARLPPQARRAVALRYIADLTEAEVARVMGVSRGTVATTLHRARKSLAQQLGSQEEGTRS